MQKTESFPTTDPDKKETESAKRRRVGVSRPLMSSAWVQSYKPCTYCGLNLACKAEAGNNFNNMKRHWALKHTVELCHEMGVEVNDSVSPKDFIQHLDKVDLVFNSINTYNYKIVPAAIFFEIT